MDCSILDSESDPDLLGIGVRLSIYIQVFLPIILEITTIVVSGGRPGSVPRKDIAKSGLLSSVYILVTGYAVIFSAIILAKTRHLTAYHALLTLNLNWLISLASTDVFYFFGDLLPSPLARSTERRTSTGSLTIICFLVFLATGIHLTLTSAFGLWLFSSPQTFTSQSQIGCTSTNVLSIFGTDFPAFEPRFRIMWLIIYAIFLLPLFNVVLVRFIIFFVWLFAVHIWWIGALFIFLVWRRRRTVKLPMSAVIPEVWTQYRDGLSLNVYPPCMIVSFTFTKFLIIILTEHTIYRNPSRAGQGEWTFGQTLVLFLTLPIILKTIYDSLAVGRNYDESKNNKEGNNAVHWADQTQLPWPLERRSARPHDIKLNISHVIHVQSDESDVEPGESDKKKYKTDFP